MPTIKSSLILILSAVLIISGCSSDRETRHSFTVDEIDGVLSAINTGAPKYSEELFKYEKVLELQQDESNLESLLNRPEAITMDSQGFFYIQDFGNSRVAVFDSTGQFAFSIGRPGEGPGEFRAVWILDLHGDLLTLYDYRLGRTTLFKTNGTLVDVIPCPQSGGRPMGQYITSEGHRVLTYQPYDIRDNLRVSRVQFVTLSANLDTIGLAESNAVPSMYSYPMRVLDQEVPFWQGIPFAPTPEAVYSASGGVLFSAGVSPILQWYNLDGSLRLQVALDLPKVTVTAHERAEYIADLDRRIEEADADRKEGLMARRDNLVFPEVKAYWSAVLVDDAGFTWLRIPESRDEREEAGGGYAYRLLSPEGEYLGITRQPTTGGQVARGHLLWFKTDPETDEEIPTVWRLVPQTGGFRYP